MKKLFLFSTLCFFLTATMFAQQRPLNKKDKEEKAMEMPADRQTANARTNGRILIFETEGSISQGYYFNILHPSRNMYRDYKYEVEVQVYSGNPDLYIYGDSGYKRDIRYSSKSGTSSESSYYELPDLRSNEYGFVIGIYGVHHSRFKVRIYKTKITGGHTECIDPTKINPNGICTQQYAPVCGCDGKTYSNSCVAENAGVTSYTSGPCNGGGNTNQCHYTNPINDFSWLKDIRNKYPNYQICEYKYNNATYFKVFQCGVSHYTEYWYNCEGHKVCEFQNGQSCSEIHNPTFVKCWYEPCNNNQHCTWKFWYDDCKDGKEIPAGSDYYVKVNTEKYQDIQWMELYVNGQKIRRESSSPYEWCLKNSSGDNQLRRLQPGTYKLKCVILDRCGDYHEEYCTFYVKHQTNTCDYGLAFTHGKHNSHYPANSDVYVKVDAHNSHDIEWCEMYIDNQLIRRETSAPYEWGRPNTSGDSQLRHMRHGTYKLKCYYKTTCGKYYEEYSTIYVD